MWNLDLNKKRWEIIKNEELINTIMSQYKDNIKIWYDMINDLSLLRR